MRRQQVGTGATQRYEADAALGERSEELLNGARDAEAALHAAQRRRAPEHELRDLAEKLDAALTSAVQAAFAAREAAIGPRGYEDRIYHRKKMATPRVHTLTAQAEHLLTLRETHRLNGIPG